MHPSVKNFFIEFNEPIENRVPFMYLDKKGLVTIGVGNLIDVENGSTNRIIAKVRALPFIYKQGVKFAGQKANANAIEAEWKDVKEQQQLKNGPLSNFEQITKLQLDDTAINTLAMTKLDAMEKELMRCPDYWDFGEWPADAQLGLLSMAWALGTPKLKTGWSNFRAACKKQDFRTAAMQCHIIEIGNPGVAKRNQRNLILFNNAAAVPAHYGRNTASNRLMRMTLHFPFVLPLPTRSRGKIMAV